MSIIIGIGLFDDELRGGIGALAVDAVALLIMCAGLFVLTQSPLIAGAVDQEQLGKSRLVHTRHKVREASGTAR